MTEAVPPPLVAHVVHGFGTGGLENGLVNIINRAPAHRYRHAIVCLTHSEAFASRIARPDVRIISLRRRAGHDFALYARLWQALRSLRPAIVHTRNLAALEAQIPAFLLPGVRRVHGEHGRDVFDIDGTNRKYNALRRAIRPLVQRYIAVSRDLAGWLESQIGVPPARIRQIYNGVAVDQFSPRDGARPALAPPGFLPSDAVVIGTVGRLARVKDQRTLLRAVAMLLREHPMLAPRLRLVIVGDGALRMELEDEARASGLSPVVWFTGDRDDVADLLRLMDVFVLPSLGEGVSNTILEAMATGLPVIATRVGGNPELVQQDSTGALVPPGNAGQLAAVLFGLIADPARRARCGAEARAEVMRRFDWARCVDQYLGVYDELLGRAGEPIYQSQF
jgi:sugar transferase (PEP-CTERM/EpsH1 system associated)